MAKLTPAVYLLRVIAFFALGTEKLDVQEHVFAVCKMSILMFALLRICALSVQVLHRNCKFYTARKNCVFAV